MPVELAQTDDGVGVIVGVAGGAFTVYVCPVNGKLVMQFPDVMFRPSEPVPVPVVAVTVQVVPLPLTLVIVGPVKPVFAKVKFPLVRPETLAENVTVQLTDDPLQVGLVLARLIEETLAEAELLNS